MREYKVYVNGQEVKVSEATVSALPVNKNFVNDYIQRPLSQTETAYYVTVDMDDEILMEIEVNEAFDTFETRPLAYDLQAEREENKISLKIKEPMQFTVEIDGHHHALHVFVNPVSEKPEGNVLYFPRGEHHVGVIWLESHQHIYLEEGATVYGVIYGKDVHDVKITGRGVIDSSMCPRGNDELSEGQAYREYFREKGFSPDDMKYISTLVLYHCKNIYVEGIILKDAPLWSVIIRNNCENITVDNIKLIGHWRYNSDGIDVCVSKNVTVKNCFVRSFDDCIVVRGAYLPEEEGNVENVVIENCVCWCDWGISLEVWTGSKNTTIRNVVFRNNYLIRLTGIAIDVQSHFGNDNIVIENLVYDGVYIDAHDYEKPIVEKCSGTVESVSRGYVPSVLVMRTLKLGKMDGQGTQLFIPADDLSQYHFSYRNIILNRVKYSGKELNVIVQPQKGVLDIENVTVKDCDFCLPQIG